MTAVHTLNGPEAERLRDLIMQIDPKIEAEYVRTVTIGLIAAYAEISGDTHPLHVDPTYASKTIYKRPIGHGAMLVGFMSTASTILSDKIEETLALTNVSLGYDKLRFPAPIFAGDVVRTHISIQEMQPDKLRVICREECTNQDGNVVAVGSHVMRFL